MEREDRRRNRSCSMPSNKTTPNSTSRHERLDLPPLLRLSPLAPPSSSVVFSDHPRSPPARAFSPSHFAHHTNVSADYYNHEARLTSASLELSRPPRCMHPTTSVTSSLSPQQGSGASIDLQWLTIVMRVERENEHFICAVELGRSVGRTGSGGRRARRSHCSRLRS